MMLVRPQYARREQRKHHRHALHPRVWFRVGEGPWIDVFCRDISLGGAFFETSTFPLFAMELEVAVEVPGAHEIRVVSTVRWTSTDGIGVQFGPMSARDTHALVGWFESESRASASRD